MKRLDEMDMENAKKAKSAGEKHTTLFSVPAEDFLGTKIPKKVSGIIVNVKEDYKKG